jgi:hypothetical protein
MIMEIKKQEKIKKGREAPAPLFRRICFLYPAEHDFGKLHRIFFRALRAGKENNAIAAAKGNPGGKIFRF